MTNSAQAPVRAPSGEDRPISTEITLRSALEASAANTTPFRYWAVRHPLPEDVALALTKLPFAPPKVGDTHGRRATHNESRTFLNHETRQRFPVCEDVAQAFQSPESVEIIEKLCDLDLAGSSLRIEICLDTEGFWLEPHTDIGAKLFTMQIYLSDGPGHEALGTDLYDQRHRFIATIPADFNSALIFAPGDDTWHGFRKRRIHGIRRSIIVNYVKPEWQQRQELAFPDHPVK